MSPGGLLKSVSAGLLSYLFGVIVLTYLTVLTLSDGRSEDSALEVLQRFSYLINFVGAIGGGAVGTWKATASGAETRQSAVMTGIAGPGILTFVLAPLAATGEEPTSGLFPVVLGLAAAVAGAWLGAALVSRRAGRTEGSGPIE